MRHTSPGLLFLITFSGGTYPDAAIAKGFDPGDCFNIPVDIEGFRYLDPSSKNRKISCAGPGGRATSLSEEAPLNFPFKRLLPQGNKDQPTIIQFNKLPDVNVLDNQQFLRISFS